jgi:hypothetical protein
MDKNPLENLVEKLGGLDELSKEERDVYFSHLKLIEGKVLSIDDMKTFIRQVITVVERELVDAEEGTHKSLGLKSRLKNMLVIESFLYGPERAKKTIENYYSNLKI